MESQRTNPVFAEMLSNSSETIFLEAIDQFFENEFCDCMINPDDFGDFDFNIEKMNDKFCDSLDEGMNSTKSMSKDMSTSIDLEENSFHNSFLAPKKKLLINNYLFINQGNINKAREKILGEYLPLIAP